MNRKIWAALIIGGAIYQIAAVHFGFKDGRTACSEWFDCVYWSGTALLMSWYSQTRRTSRH